MKEESAVPYSQPENRDLCMLWASNVGGSSGGNRFLPLHLKQNVHAEEPLRDELAFCDGRRSPSSPFLASNCHIYDYGMEGAAARLISSHFTMIFHFKTCRTY